LFFGKVFFQQDKFAGEIFWQENLPVRFSEAVPPEIGKAFRALALSTT
jgi:hypothetical protein